MIIGVTGAICSGTSFFIEHLVKMRKYGSFSYSDILREELRKRRKEVTREALQDLGDELRREHGAGILSRMMIDKMTKDKNYVIGNMRNPGEVDEFRRKFGKDFFLVLVHAGFSVRFKRAVARARENEPLDLEGFKKMEARDMGVNQREYGQQHAYVFDMADYLIANDGSLREFEKRIDWLLEELRKNG